MFDNLAVVCRATILASLMISAALAIINAVAQFGKGKHFSTWDKTNRILKAVAITTYGGGAIYGTYARFDKEFTWGLPPMAIGALLFCIYLWRAGDGDPKAPIEPMGKTDESPPLGIAR